jgi:hypothetical protein
MVRSKLVGFTVQSAPQGAGNPGAARGRAEKVGGTMTRASVAALLLLSAGCTVSLQDVRQQGPARTSVIKNQKHDVLAGCVTEKLETSPRGYFAWAINTGTSCIG